MESELLLVDLSSIAYPIYLTSQSEPDANATSTKIIDRVRAMATQHPHAAICCDSGKSFRHDVDPTYKANRPEKEAALHHQIGLAREVLQSDGFPIWAVKGFEADDLIATATARALEIEGASVLIASGDKDLLQLVGPRVTAKSVRDGSLIDAAAVKAKFGVEPKQMLDYLSLVGDTSDNIKGAKGIGEKRAVDLLLLFGSLDACYAAIEKGEAKLPAAIANSLEEFKSRKDTVRKLITLAADVEIPFAEIAAERAPRDSGPIAGMDDAEPAAEIPPPVVQGAATVTPAVAAPREVAAPVNGNGHANGGNGHGHGPVAQSQGLVPREGDVLAAAPVEFEKQLEPRSLGQAGKLAEYMHKARLFNGYGSPEAVLSTIMAGRELGMQAIASLRGFHIVEGKHALAADLIRALVLRSGLADFFKCTERSAERATFTTHRKGDPDATPTVLTYTIAEGRLAFGITADLSEKEAVQKEIAWTRSGWGRNPADMCVARAGSKLARLVYPEVSFGLYAPEELD